MGHSQLLRNLTTNLTAYYSLSILLGASLLTTHDLVFYLVLHCLLLRETYPSNLVTRLVVGFDSIGLDRAG